MLFFWGHKDCICVHWTLPVLSLYISGHIYPFVHSLIHTAAFLSYTIHTLQCLVQGNLRMQNWGLGIELLTLWFVSLCSLYLHWGGKGTSRSLISSWSQESNELSCINIMFLPGNDFQHAGWFHTSTKRTSCIKGIFLSLILNFAAHKFDFSSK